MPDTHVPQPEPHPKAHALTHDPEFQALVRRKNSISTTLTILMMTVYFGFAVVLAWQPELLSAPAGRATIGIPIGIGIIVFAWVLTGIYVNWANTKYDSMIAHLKARVEKAEFDKEESDRAVSEKEIQS